MMRVTIGLSALCAIIVGVVYVNNDNNLKLKIGAAIGHTKVGKHMLRSAIRGEFDRLAKARKLQSTSSRPVWGELMSYTCDGGMHAFGNSPLAADGNMNFFMSAIDLMFDQVWQVAECECPGMTRTEFQRMFTISFPAVLAAMTNQTEVGLDRAQWQCASNLVHSLGGQNLFLRLINSPNLKASFLPYTFTLQRYEEGEPIGLQLQIPQLETSFRVAIRKCPAPEAVFPFMSLTCNGAGCSTLGVPCNTDDQCGGGSLRCLPVADYNYTSADFRELLTSLELWDEGAESHDDLLFGFSEEIYSYAGRWFGADYDAEFDGQGRVRLCGPVPSADKPQDFAHGMEHAVVERFTSSESAVSCSSHGSLDPRLQRCVAHGCVLPLASVGDGECHPACYNADCDWDGGDCASKVDDPTFTALLAEVRANVTRANSLSLAFANERNTTAVVRETTCPRNLWVSANTARSTVSRQRYDDGFIIPEHGYGKSLVREMHLRVVPYWFQPRDADDDSIGYVGTTIYLRRASSNLIGNQKLVRPDVDDNDEGMSYDQQREREFNRVYAAGEDNGEESSSSTVDVYDRMQPVNGSHWGRRIASFGIPGCANCDYRWMIDAAALVRDRKRYSDDPNNWDLVSEPLKVVIRPNLDQQTRVPGFPAMHNTSNGFDVMDRSVASVDLLNVSQPRSGEELPELRQAMNLMGASSPVFARVTSRRGRDDYETSEITTESASWEPTQRSGVFRHFWWPKSRVGGRVTINATFRSGMRYGSYAAVVSVLTLPQPLQDYAESTDMPIKSVWQDVKRRVLLNQIVGGFFATANSTVNHTARDYYDIETPVGVDLPVSASSRYVYVLMNMENAIVAQDHDSSVHAEMAVDASVRVLARPMFACGLWRDNQLGLSEERVSDADRDAMFTTCPHGDAYINTDEGDWWPDSSKYTGSSFRHLMPGQIRRQCVCGSNVDGMPVVTLAVGSRKHANAHMYRDGQTRYLRVLESSACSDAGVPVPDAFVPMERIHVGVAQCSNLIEAWDGAELAAEASDDRIQGKLNILPAYEGGGFNRASSASDFTLLAATCDNSAMMNGLGTMGMAFSGPRGMGIFGDIAHVYGKIQRLRSTTLWGRSRPTDNQLAVRFGFLNPLLPAYVFMQGSESFDLDEPAYRRHVNGSLVSLLWNAVHGGTDRDVEFVMPSTCSWASMLSGSCRFRLETLNDLLGINSNSAESTEAYVIAEQCAKRVEQAPDTYGRGWSFKLGITGHIAKGINTMQLCNSDADCPSSSICYDLSDDLSWSEPMSARGDRLTSEPAEAVPLSSMLDKIRQLNEEGDGDEDRRRALQEVQTSTPTVAVSSSGSSEDSSEDSSESKTVFGRQVDGSKGDLPYAFLYGRLARFPRPGPNAPSCRDPQGLSKAYLRLVSSIAMRDASTTAGAGRYAFTQTAGPNPAKMAMCVPRFDDSYDVAGNSTSWGENQVNSDNSTGTTIVTLSGLSPLSSSANALAIPAAGQCGNGRCEMWAGESCSSCSMDGCCGAVAPSPSNRPQPSPGGPTPSPSSTPRPSPSSSPAPPVCGDGICTTGVERARPYALYAVAASDRVDPADVCFVDCGWQESVIGDGQCDVRSETCVNAPMDCGACPVFCGDFVCDISEVGSCTMDCGLPVSDDDAPAATPTVAMCGDGVCSANETCSSCPTDCADNVCSPDETCTCRDCGLCATCGDGRCDGGEDQFTCSADCGRPNFCGDGVCFGVDALSGAEETCQSCQVDCGSCSDTVASYGGVGAAQTGGLGTCGDGACWWPESASNCATDCSQPSAPSSSSGSGSSNTGSASTNSTSSGAGAGAGAGAADTARGSCAAFGDPAFTTLDGTPYHFNGVGEYKLLVAAADTAPTGWPALQVQGRLIQCHATAQGSCLRAIAAQFGPTRIFISCPDAANTRVSCTVRVNNRPLSFPSAGGTTQLNSGDTTVRFVPEYELDATATAQLVRETWEITSTAMGVVLRLRRVSGYATVAMDLPASYRGKVEGFMGNWNGDDSDDFLEVDGRVMRAITTARILVAHSTLWSVTRDASLFYYNDQLGESYASINNVDFEPMITADFGSNTALEALARAECTRLGLTGAFFDTCLFDAAATGTTESAVASLEGAVASGNVDPDTVTCPRDCSGRGSCLSGVCVCNAGWTLVDCSAPTTSVQLPAVLPGQDAVDVYAAAAATPQASPPAAKTSSSTPVGGIVGGVIGGLVVLIVVGIWCRKAGARQSQVQTAKRRSAASSATGPPVMGVVPVTHNVMHRQAPRAPQYPPLGTGPSRMGAAPMRAGRGHGY